MPMLGLLTGYSEVGSRRARGKTEMVTNNDGEVGYWYT